MGSPPAQLMDSGLCGLSLVAGYYRIAGDPAQLKHQLALTGRSAQAEDIVHGANILQLKSRILRKVTARRLGTIPYPAILGLKEGGFAVLGAGSAKGLARLVDPIGRTAQELSMEAIAALSSGEVVLITRRVGARASIPTPSDSAGSGPRFFATCARSPMC
jgi:subfamily B ATP-binding cassette protein HlyB/CyaB